MVYKNGRDLYGFKKGIQKLNDLVIDKIICDFCGGIIENDSDFESDLIQHLLSFHPEMKKIHVQIDFGKSALVDLIINSVKN